MEGNRANGSCNIKPTTQYSSIKNCCIQINRPPDEKAGDLHLRIKINAPIFNSHLPRLQHFLRHLIESQTDDLTRRIAPHRDAIDDIRGLNSITVMGNDDELSIPAQFLQKIAEAAHIS